MRRSPAPLVCLVTTGHLSTNPRLVKEADALTEAGYRVHIVATKFWEWAEAADAGFASRSWAVDWIRFGEFSTRVGGTWTRLRHRLAREAVAQVGAERVPVAVLHAALHPVTPDLTRAALAVEADLYIAHNLGALPAAVLAARRHQAALGFDAEDFHRGELPETAATSAQRALVAAVEARYLPDCDYVTAASDGIAQAYAEAVGIETPTTVLNVFPLAERDVVVPPEDLAEEVPLGARSLHWFSQTIGSGRGLEDAVRALPLLPDDIVLSLRGGWAVGYERLLRSLADDLGVGHRIHALGHCPPEQVARRAAEHDVGLALELGETVNRDLCVTNKVFTYLLAGLPVAATATTGQRGVCASLPGATRLYPPGEVAALAQAVRDLLTPRARLAAAEAGLGRYTWDYEKDTFLRLVANTLSGQHP